MAYNEIIEDCDSCQQLLRRNKKEELEECPYCEHLFLIKEGCSCGFNKEEKKKKVFIFR